MYNLDTGKWPASLEELLSTKGNGPYIKMSENGYDFNKTVFIGINSKPASEIKTAETILAYDLSGVRPDTSGKAAIIFADGHIEYWTKGKLDENLNIVKPKADSGRGIYGTIYDAPSEDWWEEYFTKLANAETMSEFSRILESQVNTKKPASGITVRLIDTLGKARITKETKTNKNGKYEFTELGVGKYQRSAEKMTVSKRTGNTSDAIAQSRWFELYESSLHPKRVEQNLSLDDGYITVSGRVLDESGKPMAGAKVCGTSTPLENDGIGETDETTRIFAAQQICEITDENGYYELKGFRAANFYDTFRYLINTNKGIRGAYKFFVNITADSQDGTYRGKLERIPLVGENQAYRARCLLNELNKLCEKTGEEVHPENMDLEWPLAKSKGGKLVDVDIHLERKISEPNFDDLSFWQGEIAKYMQAVRTVDGEFISSRQVYEKGKKEPKTYRKEIKFKWNRDNTWYDYSVSDLENNLHQTRVVRNSTEAWWENSGGKSANRTKPEDNGGMIMQGFGFSPEDKWWPGDALDINSVATLIASRELRGLKYQAKWDLMPQACKPLDNNQYELTLKSQMTWGWPAKQSDMTLIVEWDGAMKPISINYKVDNDKPIVKCMWSDHIKVGDNWFARKAIQYEYDGETEFEKTALVSEATTIIAKKVIFNRPITED